MPQRPIGIDVFEAALERCISVYRAGHRVVVSFSGGKDSGVCLELCILAAEATGNLPIDVVMRDEEIMLPGTFEYCERVASRPEVRFHWLIANQPVINVFDRVQPYFWVFDPVLSPDQWVRQPPDFAITIPDKNIEAVVSPERFPPAEGKMLVSVIGLRVSESIRRRMGLMSSGGYLTKPDRYKGVLTSRFRPIYDMKDEDVWKCHADFGWDYNTAYDVMARTKISKRDMRIAPPTLTAAGIGMLDMARRAWPMWFDRVSNRLRGVRTAAMFGRRAVEPDRKYGETWEECYVRECLEEVPAEWIRDRAKTVMERVLANHKRHSTAPFPQNEMCPKCGLLFSWKRLCKAMWSGDPFSLKQDFLKPIEPEFFREGAGIWGGTPAFK